MNNDQKYRYEYKKNTYQALLSIYIYTIKKYPFHRTYLKKKMDCHICSRGQLANPKQRTN